MGKENLKSRFRAAAKVVEVSIILASAAMSCGALYLLSIFWWPESWTSVEVWIIILVTAVLPIVLVTEIYTYLKPKSHFLMKNGFRRFYKKHLNSNTPKDD